MDPSTTFWIYTATSFFSGYSVRMRFRSRSAIILVLWLYRFTFRCSILSVTLEMLYWCLTHVPYFFSGTLSCFSITYWSQNFIAAHSVLMSVGSAECPMFTVTCQNMDCHNFITCQCDISNNYLSYVLWNVQRTEKHLFPFLYPRLAG
jgi:hypothetical protein